MLSSISENKQMIDQENAWDNEFICWGLWIVKIFDDERRNQLQNSNDG